MVVAIISSSNSIALLISLFKSTIPFFKPLVSIHFKFNEDTWRYEYKSKGRDDSLTKRLIASANPYDFEQDPNHQFQLIIEENEVLGFYVKSRISLCWQVKKQQFEQTN